MEEWKDIGDTGYRVSNLGRIMLPSGWITRHHKFEDYLDSPVGKVHQLVAFFFLEHPEAEKNGKYSFEGYHVHHKDGNKFNNCVENLEYLTVAEHRAKHRGHRVKQKRKSIPAEKPVSKRSIFENFFLNI